MRRITRLVVATFLALNTNACAVEEGSGPDDFRASTGEEQCPEPAYAWSTSSPGLWDFCGRDAVVNRIYSSAQTKSGITSHGGKASFILHNVEVNDLAPFTARLGSGDDYIEFQVRFTEGSASGAYIYGTGGELIDIMLSPMGTNIVSSGHNLEIGIQEGHYFFGVTDYGYEVLSNIEAPDAPHDFHISAQAGAGITDLAFQRAATPTRH